MLNNWKHGKSNTPIYKVWTMMIQRCTNPKTQPYPYYGGRGIKVCERWLDFVNFFTDMGDGWRKGLMIEREDNDGPYAPYNCYWATKIIEANNTRRTRRWPHEGAMKTLRDLSQISTLKMSTIKHRLKLGWCVEDAISLPVQSQSRQMWTNQGSHHGMAKLTEQAVLKIRELRQSGATICSIAKGFSLSASNISHIVSRKTWRHV